MPLLDPIPPLEPVPALRPARPSGARRALRVVPLAVLGLVVIGGVVFTVSSLSFLWEGEPVEPAVGAAGPVVRHFFELQDDRAAPAEAVEGSLDVALGTVRVGRTEEGALFQAEVDLTSARLRPRFEGEARDGRARVALSLGGEEVSLRGVRAPRGNVWRLYFSERVPLSLDLNLGAAEADLDFTGIPLARLSLDCGLAKATLRFDEPNPVLLEHLAISAGLSDFTARGLGHARFAALDFEGGAGEFTLDFTGDALRPGATAAVSVGMASLTLVLPARHPVVLDAASSFMTHVEVPPGLEQRSKGHWATPGAETDAHALRIAVNTGPGNVRVRFAD